MMEGWILAAGVEARVGSDGWKAYDVCARAVATHAMLAGRDVVWLVMRIGGMGFCVASDGGVSRRCGGR